MDIEGLNITSVDHKGVYVSFIGLMDIEGLNITSVDHKGVYVSFIGLRLTKTSLTLSINRTRLRTKVQSAGYPQAQIVSLVME